jgi:hypothetical protein
MVAPLRALRAQAVGFVPDGVLADIGNQDRLSRLLGEHIFIVVKM